MVKKFLPILGLLLLVGCTILFSEVMKVLLGEIWAIIIIIVFVRYTFFPNKTSEEIIEVVKEAIKSFFSTTLRILIAAPFIIFIIWVNYMALTNGIPDDVCFFITSNDCL